MFLPELISKSTTVHRRFHLYSYSISSFSTLAASIFHSYCQQILPKPIFANPPEDPIQTPFSPLNQYKKSQEEALPSHSRKSPSFDEIPSCFSPVVPEKRDFLIKKYQYSCSQFDAEQLHLDVIKNGLHKDLFLCNTLISVYGRVGDMVAAYHLFAEMSERNSVTWACLVSGCNQNDMFEDACHIFREMLVSGLFPNHYAVGSALRACQALRASGLRFGMQIHGLISKTPHSCDVLVCNVLISMYGSCMSSAEYAWQVFYGIKFRNLISWNSIISVYSQREDAVSAFKLFSGLQKEGSVFSFRPTQYTFGSLITAASCSCVFVLEQTLAAVEKTGYVQDLYVGSALVSGFSRFGMLDTANKIFEQMGTRNAATLNGLMIGLVRLGQGEQAVKVFMETRNLVRITSDSLLVLLSSFPEFSSFDVGRRKGRELHANVIRTGLDYSQVSVGNGLINMYAKCDAIEDAFSVFRLMVDRDSVSWNSIISGLDQNECFEDALIIFHRMKSTGLVPSNFTIISVLSSCGKLGWIAMGGQLHSEGLKLGLDFDVSVSNALLSLYANCGFIATCRKLFSLMTEYDQVSWNSIIGALSGSDIYGHDAIGYFKEMMQSGWKLNKVTFINVLEALVSPSLLELAHQVHSLVLKYGAMNDSSIENALLSCYGKCGAINLCENIFSRMLGRRDEVSWNCMISGYIHNELLSKAMNLVWLMLQNGQRLDSFTFASVLSACASVATLERGMEVHACAVRSCLESDVVIGSALVDMYTKCGRIDYASRFFELMPVRNVYSWNSMISGYARHGYGHKALDLFSRMKMQGQSPDHVTFVGVLSACSHVGLVEKGFYHFESMSNLYGLIPQMEHYSCIVDLLGRAGKLEKIEDFINRMPMMPNNLIWRTVLGACSRANGRRRDLGNKAAQMLMELEPQNAANYVLLANMHASGGRWADVAEARHAMREAAVRKEAGCSWVTMKDGVHVFVSGDKSHPDKDAIYAKLKELHLKIKDAGYVPELKFAMYDLEQENKEELLSYHSERLAVAFILTRKSELPIRIMKNLRICGDCHSAFKYISEIVGRQIILRDSNRFHHFVGGKCSCNDYW